MKRLRKLALNLDRKAWGNDYGYSFYMQSRFLCAYLERSLSKNKIELLDSSKLCINGYSDSSDSFNINSSGIAVVKINFDKEEFDSCITDEDRARFFGLFLERGLSCLPADYYNASNELLSLSKPFVKEHSSFSWLYKKKLVRSIGVTVSLECELSQSQFDLYLRVFRKGSIISSHHLLSTEPDELAYHYKFKDIELRDDELIITSRSSAPLMVFKYVDL